MSFKHLNYYITSILSYEFCIIECISRLIKVIEVYTMMHGQKKHQNNRNHEVWDSNSVSIECVAVFLTH